MKDIVMPREPLPAGWVLVEGKQLMIWSRVARIPWAVARKRTPCGDSFRMETVGIIIREEDVEKFEGARNAKRMQGVKA